MIAAFGLVIEIAFLLLAVWARQLLGRNWSGAVAIKVDQALIRSGPYNFVRHPIYSGMLGAYLGIAIISGEVHALLGLILACFAYSRKIRIEEQYLSTVFGSAYVDYQAHVSALIPGVL
jgi:protein-S-isoprenylcysteine O-methyltransferase Ste14